MVVVNSRSSSEVLQLLPGCLLFQASLSLVAVAVAVAAGLDVAFVALTGRSPDNRD